MPDSGRDRPVLFAFWPATRAGEANLAFGVRRRIVLLFLPAQTPLVSATVFLLVMESLGWALLTATASVVLLVAPLFGDRAFGWFLIDDRARVVDFVSALPPPSVEGRKGVSRKRFMQEVREDGPERVEGSKSWLTDRN
jgi:hypothetical protein